MPLLEDRRVDAAPRSHASVHDDRVVGVGLDEEAVPALRAATRCRIRKTPVPVTRDLKSPARTPTYRWRRSVARRSRLLHRWLGVAELWEPVRKGSLGDASAGSAPSDHRGAVDARGAGSIQQVCLVVVVCEHERPGAPPPFPKGAGVVRAQSRSRRHRVAARARAHDPRCMIVDRRRTRVSDALRAKCPRRTAAPAKYRQAEAQTGVDEPVDEI